MVLLLLSTDPKKLLKQSKGPNEVESMDGLKDYRVKIGKEYKKTNIPY